MMLLAAILSAWLQYGADGQPHVRAVATTSCPAALVDGHALTMRLRSGTANRFNDVVCELAIPDSAKSVRVGTHVLPAPVRKLATIVILGDTGCRIKGSFIQGCNDPLAWPFPLIAKSIAKVHPDLIVHVGDYLYRESACPPQDTRCVGSPAGDIAQAWNADWFAPGSPLFASAPLVLARGNHEVCKRAGTGWFRYLDAHTSTACQEMTQPYALSFPNLRLVVADSAPGNDQLTDTKVMSEYQAAFNTARTLASGPTWLVTHRPPYFNVNERAAMGGDLAPFSAVIAGHIHLFAAMNIKDLPPLIINGEGGDKLDTEIAPILSFGLGNLRTLDAPFIEPRFGFGIYTRNANGWHISLRNADGSERARCNLANGNVRC